MRQSLILFAFVGVLFCNFTPRCDFKEFAEFLTLQKLKYVVLRRGNGLLQSFHV